MPLRLPDARRFSTETSGSNIACSRSQANSALAIGLYLEGTLFRLSPRLTVPSLPVVVLTRIQRVRPQVALSGAPQRAGS
jgi:hypothetical protein